MGEIDVALLDEHPVGFIHSRACAADGLEIRALVVVQECRRRGIGRALIDETLTKFSHQTSRTRRVVVVTSPRNLPMLALLTSLGFVARELLANYFGDGRHRLRFERPSALLGINSGRIERTSIHAEDHDRLTSVLRGGFFVYGVETTSPGHLLLLGRRDGSTMASLGAPCDRPVLAVSSRPPSVTRKGIEEQPLDRVASGGQSTTQRARGAVLSGPVSLAIPSSPADQEIIPHQLRRNGEAPWSDFNPNAYFKRNYAKLLQPDRDILTRTGSFFLEQAEACTRTGGVRRWERALDIGTGPNLYPMLAMLPFVDEIILGDISPANVRWLTENLADDFASWTWRPFWQSLPFSTEPDDTHTDPHSLPPDVLEQVRSRARPRVMDVFTLGEREWDAGTMFFVAESITSDRQEFTTAVRRFLRSLKPGAPFAAAFMAGSTGYRVDDELFPAVSVGEEQIREAIGPYAMGLECSWIDPDGNVRDPTDESHYDGMVLVLGLAAEQDGQPRRRHESTHASGDPSDLVGHSRVLLP